MIKSISLFLYTLHDRCQLSYCGYLPDGLHDEPN